MSIEIIAVLTSISKDDNGFHIALDDIAGEVRVLDIDEAQAREVVNECDLEVSDTNAFNITKIQLEKLCFVVAKCTSSGLQLVNGDMTFKLQPVDVKVLDINYIQENWNTLDKKKKDKISKILLALKKLDSDIKSEFNFVKLNNYKNTLVHFLSGIKMTKQTKLTSFFTKQTTMVESQNDFNSQAMNTQQFTSQASIPGISDDELIDSDDDLDNISEGSYPTVTRLGSTKHDLPTNHNGSSANKHSKKDSCLYVNFMDPHRNQLWTYNGDNSSVIISHCSLQSMSPVGFKSLDDLDKFTLRLVFKQKTMVDELLIPNNNCCEVVIKNKLEYMETFGRLADTSSKLRKYLNGDLNITVKKWKYEIRGYDSFKWTIEKLDFNPEMPVKEKVPEQGKCSNRYDFNSINFIDESTRDQVIQFKDMIFEEENTAKFYIVFGYLLACSTDNSNYANFVFTDFTTNRKYEQKYTFDRYINDYNTKLDHDQSFRVISYYNHFNEFNMKVKAKYGKDLNAMVNENSQIADKNVSKYGILCRIVMKCKLYQSVLNLVERDIELLDNLHELSIGEKPYIKELFNKTEPYLTASPTLNVNGDIASSKTTRESKEQVPCITDITQYKVVEDHNISQLNHLQHLTPKIYVLNVYIIDVEIVYDQEIRIKVVNELPMVGKYVPPVDILEVYITGKEEVQNFLGDEALTMDIFTPLLNETSRLRVFQRPSKTDRIIRWSPIECTIQELRLQRMFRLRDAIKVEETLSLTQ